MVLDLLRLCPWKTKEDFKASKLSTFDYLGLSNNFTMIAKTAKILKPS